MKAIKIYLVVVSILLVIAIGFGIYVWYVVQNLNMPSEQVLQQGTADSQTVTTPESSVQSTQQPLVIKKSDLPATQQKMLETLGIDGETITITSTMLTCAEKAVGATRLTEIQKGSTPSTMESIKLLPCLKS